MHSGLVSVTRLRDVSIITIFSTYYSSDCKTVTNKGTGIWVVGLAWRTMCQTEILLEESRWTVDISHYFTWFWMHHFWMPW